MIVKEPGEVGFPGKTPARNLVAEYSSVLPVKNVPPPSDVRSRKFVQLLKIMDVIRGCLAAGASVNELQIQHLSRKYPGDSLRAMRKCHQTYPRSTRLILENGIWRIEPVMNP